MIKNTYNEIHGPGVSTELRGTADERIEQAMRAHDLLAANQLLQSEEGMRQDGVSEDDIEAFREMAEQSHREQRCEVLAQVQKLMGDP